MLHKNSSVHRDANPYVESSVEDASGLDKFWRWL
jgi:hypothetical protein